ncbi:uncharacterized protein [Arachis hypogaea]|uniref:uncharacterized protein n=1 Tax=Arachis hypogaea TaxID=3818 RepID=UPI003B2282D5
MSVYSKIQKKKISIEALSQLLVDGSTEIEKQDMIAFSKITLQMNWCVISVFEDEYLQKLNPNDVRRLLQMAEGRGFPSMLGSIDCMHWQWKNYPKAWKGMYMSGYRGVATIVLEVVASSDLWIWHAFFGVSCSNNDINMLDRSPVFDDILNNRASELGHK